MDDDDKYGRWVPASEVDPLTNVSGLRWRDEDGLEGVFYGLPWNTRDGIRPRVAAWYFPKAPDSPTVTFRTWRSGPPADIVAAFDAPPDKWPEVHCVAHTWRPKPGVTACVAVKEPFPSSRTATAALAAALREAGYTPPRWWQIWRLSEATPADAVAHPAFRPEQTCGSVSV
ncbi:MAG: hypothetical protein VXW57_10520 [Pseudomonadota bacterium]|nr:hypothetical protein [Pseudomonadota bacterium]